MKKTVTVNLNGRVFTMDEDAYLLLDKYLLNLRIYFRKEEGASEIISDFEARIEELFSERIRLGYEVISIEQVEDVIAQVGRPDDFDSETSQEDNAESQEESYEEYPYPPVKKKFFRNMDNKMFGGVCSGIASYFGWDVLAVRIIMIILLFVTQAFIVLAYLIFWLLAPAARTAEQKLQMQGKPITVENIGKTVAAEAEQQQRDENGGCLNGFVEFFVGLAKIVLVGLGCLLAIPLLFVLFIIAIVLFSVLFGVGGGLLAGIFHPFDLDYSVLIAENPVLVSVAAIFLLGIPLVSIIYLIINYFAKLKPVHNSVKWTCLIIWIISLVVLLFSGLKFNTDFFHGNWTVHKYYSVTDEIAESGIIEEIEYPIGATVHSLFIEKYLWANVQIEQTQGDSVYITINGDENLIDKIKYQVNDEKLRLSTHNDAYLSPDNNIIVRIRMPELKEIKMEGAGNIQIGNVFQGDSLKIKMEGSGRFCADSLNVNYLEARSEGIGSTNLSGIAKTAQLELEGSGTIDALELQSDSVFANLEGIGNIRCAPVKYLKGKVEGIGKISYKIEPEKKEIQIEGIGKIGLE